MPNVNLLCESCGRTARRPLLQEVASRGVRETGCEPATCPSCRTPMVRQDGGQVGSWVAEYLRYRRD